MNVTKYDAVIIGAGLTGLTAGFYLRKRGMKVLLVETADRPGGVIKSVSENGFLYETGPNTGVLSSVELVKLFDDLGDRCTLESANPVADSRWIWKGNRWHALPGGLMQAVTTPLFTWGDKFRILAEPFRRRGNDPLESVASLVCRRMGKSYLDYAVDPFISGIYAGNPDYLVTKFALPKLHNLEMEYGSFIRGGIAKSMAKKSPDEARVTRAVFSARGGLASLTDSMAEVIGNENILLGCKDVVAKHGGKTFFTALSHGGKNITVESESLITTCGSHCLGDLLSFADAGELNDITTLKYARVVQVILGYRQWRGIPLEGFGGLVPSREGRDILGVLFTSSFLKNRAPEGGALLSVFLGGMRRPEIADMTDNEISDIALRETKAMLRSGEAAPDLLKIFRYNHAIPQYGRDSGARLEAIDRLEKKFPGLVLAGNIRDGIGMADRVKQGVNLAQGTGFLMSDCRCQISDIK
jgi:oxygen-dependent protoporphyrinogen oxidase